MERQIKVVLVSFTSFMSHLNEVHITICQQGSEAFRIFCFLIKRRTYKTQQTCRSYGEAIKLTPLEVQSGIMRQDGLGLAGQHANYNQFHKYLDDETVFVILTLYTTMDLK